MTEIQGKSLREFLAENGAQKNQLESKWVLKVENAMINDEISTNATVREAIDSMKRKILDCDYKADVLARGVSRVEDRYAKVSELLSQTEIAASEIAISDKGTLEALSLYGRVLETTRDVFGAEKMSEAVICKAIEAASYGMWRSIMGPKFEEKNPNRRVL